MNPLAPVRRTSWRAFSFSFGSLRSPLIKGVAPRFMDARHDHLERVILSPGRAARSQIEIEPCKPSLFVGTQPTVIGCRLSRSAKAKVTERCPVSIVRGVGLAVEWGRRDLAPALQPANIGRSRDGSTASGTGERSVRENNGHKGGR